MEYREFTYLSADGVTTIHGKQWLPACAPKAVLQIAHGITEHIGRYEALAGYFTARGYVVVGHDHLGHGLSVHDREPLPMYFGPKGSWDYVVQDVRACGALAKAQYPDLPLCLLGFSLGSFAVRTLLGNAPEAADLTIIAGTGQTNGAERLFAGAAAKLEERRFGDKTGTPLLHQLTMETYNKKFAPCRTHADWLCANPAAVDDYLADPLCGEGFTVGSFRELLTGMRIAADPKHVAKMDKTMPILLLSGAEDPVGNFGKGAEAACAAFRRAGCRDVELRLFDGMRHDIFHETAYMDVFRCMEDWLEQKLNV